MFFKKVLSGLENAIDAGAVGGDSLALGWAAGRAVGRGWGISSDQAGKFRDEVKMVNGLVV